MSETNKPPTICGKSGEFQMPQDIWDTARVIVQSLSELGGDQFAGCDLEELARTIIASALYAERAGMHQPRS